MRTTIMPGTRSKGRLWQREWIFSLRNLMFRSINPQCSEAAAQSNLGVVGSCTTKSLMEANFWSPAITTILKPCRRYILYVAWRASQTNALFWCARWVTVVKQILVLMVVRKMCLLTKNNQLPIQHPVGAWWAPWEPWQYSAPPACRSFSQCSLSS